jgi:acetoin utilization deacetylase AcuC-like enzyme
MRSASGLAYFYPEGHAAHAAQSHPESPERVETIHRALDQVGWLKRFNHLSPVAIPCGLLGSIHRTAYLDLLEMSCRRGAGYLDTDTYFTPDSWQLANQAAGGALAVAQAVWNGSSPCGFALTRPPGHHARPGQGMGFCLLNNAALAAEGILQSGARRLAIIDLDLHHGNGTQEIFWQREDVFYISTHQHPLYPYSGGLEETGAGRGEGYTANFPLPPMSGDLAFRNVMDGLIIPLLDRYQPEMILVSYGYDPHWLDPFGSLLLSAAGYASLARKLVSWADQNCGGKIAWFLEGGYNMEAAQACSLGVVAALIGEPWQDPIGPAIFPEGHTWERMYDSARKLWGF